MFPDDSINVTRVSNGWIVTYPTPKEYKKVVCTSQIEVMAEMVKATAASDQIEKNRQGYDPFSPPPTMEGMNATPSAAEMDEDKRDCFLIIPTRANSAEHARRIWKDWGVPVDFLIEKGLATQLVEVKQRRSE